MRIDSLSYLPQFIIQNPDIRELLEAEQNEIDMLEDYVELIRDQVFILVLCQDFGQLKLQNL